MKSDLHAALSDIDNPELMNEVHFANAQKLGVPMDTVKNFETNRSASTQSSSSASYDNFDGSIIHCFFRAFFNISTR